MTIKHSYGTYSKCHALSRIPFWLIRLPKVKSTKSNGAPPNRTGSPFVTTVHWKSYECNGAAGVPSKAAVQLAVDDRPLGRFLYRNNFFFPRRLRLGSALWFLRSLPLSSCVSITYKLVPSPTSACRSFRFRDRGKEKPERNPTGSPTRTKTLAQFGKDIFIDDRTTGVDRADRFTSYVASVHRTQFAFFCWQQTKKPSSLAKGLLFLFSFVISCVSLLFLSQHARFKQCQKKDG